MKTLFDDQRQSQKLELWNFGKEVDIQFKKDKDIHHQICEVLKVTLHFNKLFSLEEMVDMFPVILKAFGFPEASYPTLGWVTSEIKYIQKLKKIGVYLSWK